MFDVTDSMANHRQTLGAHAERESGQAFGVIPDGFEDIRVDHPATHQLDPTGATADATTGTVADETRNMHLGRRLGEWEKMG
jgi:hypothetical protein